MSGGGGGGGGGGGTLRERTFTSGLVVTAASIVMRMLEIVTIIVLARLLEPEHFGAVGLALVVMTSLNLFSQAGMGSAIVQTDADPHEAAYNGFVVTGTVGTVLFVLSISLAAPVAGLLGHPDLAGVFRWMSLLIPIEMLRVVPSALLIRSMEFGRQSATQVSGALAKLVCAVGAALLGLDLWSLVIGYLAGAAANTVATFVVATTRGWFHRRYWDRSLAGSLARFGAPVLSTGLIRQFYNNADDILVGSLSGTAALGFYRQAYKLGNLPVSLISHAVNTVLLPSYTRRQHQQRQLRAGYLSAFRMVGLLTVPVAFGLLILAHEGVVVALGEKWRPAAPMLMVLAIVSLVRPLSGTTGPLFTAIGKPGLNLRTAMLQGLSLLPLSLLLMRWGAIGIAWAVSLTFTLGFLYNMHKVVTSTDAGLTYGAMSRALSRLLVAGATMGAVLVGLKVGAGAAGVATETLPAAVALVTLGGSVYFGVVWALDRALLYEVHGLLRGALARRRRRDPAGRSRRPAGVAPDVIRDRLEAWARAELGAGIATEACEHLSGWKQGGAFRFHGTTDDGRDWSVIWKEARYDAADIPALTGLPIRPGPPEFAVYDRAGTALRALLPDVHSCEELEPRAHYRYLLEDLAATRTRLRNPRLAHVMAQRLPAIHSALDAERATLEADLLRYDSAFSASLLDYTTDGLRRLQASPGEWGELTAALDDWDRLAHVYSRGLRRVDANVAPQPIHGDLNPTNVWCEHGRPERLFLVDWEWAGIGFPHSDLVSALKRATPELEADAVRRYHRTTRLRSWEEDLLAYRWCKLQRALLDAGFFATQLVDAGTESPRLDLAGHVSRSVGVALGTARSIEALSTHEATP